MKCKTCDASFNFVINENPCHEREEDGIVKLHPYRDMEVIEYWYIVHIFVWFQQVECEISGTFGVDDASGKIDLNKPNPKYHKDDEV